MTIFRIGNTVIGNKSCPIEYEGQKGIINEKLISLSEVPLYKVLFENDKKQRLKTMYEFEIERFDNNSN